MTVADVLLSVPVVILFVNLYFLVRKIIWLQDMFE